MAVVIGLALIGYTDEYTNWCKTTAAVMF